MSTHTFGSGHLICEVFLHHQCTTHKFRWTWFCYLLNELVKWYSIYVCFAHTYESKISLNTLHIFLFCLDFFFTLIDLLWSYHTDYCYRNVPRSIKWKRGVVSPLFRVYNLKYIQVCILFDNKQITGISQMIVTNIFSLIWPDLLLETWGKPCLEEKPSFHTLYSK